MSCYGSVTVAFCVCRTEGHVHVVPLEGHRRFGHIQKETQSGDVFQPIDASCRRPGVTSFDQLHGRTRIAQ